MTWTPITEQLPPNGEVVEVQLQGYGSLPFEVYLNQNEYYWAFDNTKCNETPTHWRKKEGK